MSFEITSEDALREVLGPPVHEAVLEKSTATLTPPLKRFIEMSPFLALGTANAHGDSDLSPRGDPPGFVHILDDHTLVIPERPGNKRLDSVVNIINQPKLSLLFMIPGVLDTVRVNGTGVISTDPELLGRFPVNGKLPQIAIVVTVEEALGHCSKAYRRSKLWQDDHVPKSRVPTLAEMMTGHLKVDEPTMEFLESAIDDDAQNNMY
ncbi:MAG: pyridoxamine 5'-phosphate oxidase family protein [Gammaproteobacteria bacterium]|nr:pyridoxamine 5'-phosphate oxidase family protein [Gammaproteobacteria bacterium]